MTAQQDPTKVTPEPTSDAQAIDQHSEQTQTSDDPLVSLKAELEAALVQVAQHKDQVLRAHAEMENVRRRSQDEVSKARKFGIESFAEGLVPVMDILEAALAQTDQSAEDMKTGIQATLKQLVSAFERNHLKGIAPAAGEKFDPHQHQAIATIPADQPANTVVTTLQKGYLIADRVLRPALVTVSGGPAAAN